MFKKNEVVFYPSFGSTTIKRIYKETNGESYYELEFADNLTILVPTQKAEEFGLRYATEHNTLIKILSEIKGMETRDEDIGSVSKTVNQRLSTGKVKDLIYIIKLVQSISKIKESKNKKLEISERQALNQAYKLLQEEVSMVLGNQYKFNII